MTVRRRLGTAMLAITPVLAGVAMLAVLLSAGPASAHGAPTSPLSRAAACGPEGGQRAESAACRAAVTASGPDAMANWDNIRVADVAGRDRAVIPDGQLCSGGLTQFKGLDLPRTDWPVTEVAAGAAFTFKYRATIPHQGTFRLYVTKDGYDPATPLTWSALQTEPFLTVTNPTARAGSYSMAGKLPAAKTGRHLIYTVWQNSDTPDTYYSCSDVQFTTAAVRVSPSAAAPGAGGAGGGTGGAAARPPVAGAAGPAAGPERATTPRDPATAPSAASVPEPAAAPEVPAGAESVEQGAGAVRLAADRGGDGMSRQALGGVLAAVGAVLLVAVTVALTLRRRRHPRAAGPRQPDWSAEQRFDGR